MTTKQILYALIILAVIGGIAAFIGSWVQPPSTAVSSNTDDTAIRAQVTGFGSVMKNVSLLAPDAATQVGIQYGPYVTPELLATWQAHVSSAPGRQTSSPWPDSIDIVTVNTNGTSAAVEANVIEPASGSGGAVPVGVQPLSLTLEKRNGTWLISGLSMGAYSELPHQQTIVGYWECLPHKNTTGPQTTECAFGIAVDQSDGHYAVDTSLMSTYPVDYSTGTKVRVTGIVTPANQLNSIQKYDIDGVIRATVIEKI